MRAMERQANGTALGHQAIDFGREICGDLYVAEQREWLVTNGLGGFASGTVADVLTRRYHGLLFAALKPPLGRTLLAAKLEETALYDGAAYPLFTNRWAGGGVDPHGYRHIERFYLDGTTPVWVFGLGDALLEKRIWMPQGTNATYVRYELLRAGGPVRLLLKALVNYRDYHSSTRGGDWRFSVQRVEGGLRLVAYEGAVPFYLQCDAADVEPAHNWILGFDFPVERYRGLPDQEDHLEAGTFVADLAPGEAITFRVGTEPSHAGDNMGTLEAPRAHERSLIERFVAAQDIAPADCPPWIRQLVLAADQFIVRRPSAAEPEGRSIIAGYPWFGDWGRDTMISLPGLTLSTGQTGVARTILRTFAQFEDGGMLPNLFPDAGQAPEYNSVDAPLWYFEAVRQYWEMTNDASLLADLYPVLARIIDAYREGTRYQIHTDESDGLLFAGESGVQLTWMDAKVGDWVVTPRIGKPVEVNALWLNALSSQARFARALERPAAEYEAMAQMAREGFRRFWNERAGHCFDVIDGPEGDDATLRPNQIFAVSLSESPLDAGRQRSVVDVCARHLLTSFGMRSLAPSDPNYVGIYGGGPLARDGSYHQGTVWGWLLGPFALAHLRVYQDPELAASFLAPMAHHLRTHGLGTASEIFDGAPPFLSRGCTAQAWTVGEILRAWSAVRSIPRRPKPRAVSRRRKAAATT